MPIFNFKQFNESKSNLVTLTEEHRVILQDILEDLWVMDHESTRNIDRPFRPISSPEVKRGNIAIRSSVDLSPGNIPSIVDYRLAPSAMINKSEIYGFSFRVSKSESLVKRALELFKRQTGINLSTFTNDERQTIIAEPVIIKFIESVLNFESNWEELSYLLPQRYQEDVYSDVDSCELEIGVHFPVKNRQANVVGCYLDTKLSRGVIIGGDLPISDKVKYELKIGSLWNFEEKRDEKSIREISNAIKGSEHQFEFYIDDVDSSNEELLEFYELKILSKIETPTIKLKTEIESQLDQLKKYSIKSEFEYLEYDTIEMNLNWRGDEYQFYLLINKLGDQNLEGLISIKQDDKWIDKTSTEDLAETIYLNLVDGKLKISQ